MCCNGDKRRHTSQKNLLSTFHKAKTLYSDWCIAVIDHNDHGQHFIMTTKSYKSILSVGNWHLLGDFLIVTWIRCLGILTIRPFFVMNLLVYRWSAWSLSLTGVIHMQNIYYLEYNIICTESWFWFDHNQSLNTRHPFLLQP